MATIIIGLDLGNDAVKATVLKASGRKVELVGVHHRRVMPATKDGLLVPIHDPMAEETEGPDETGPMFSSDVLQALASSDDLQALGAFDEQEDEREDEAAISIEAPDPFAEEDVFEEEEEVGPYPPEVIEAARDLLKAIDEPGAQVVVAIPGQLISTWMVELPFSDQRTVAKVLPGELAMQVPFPMEDMVLDWRTLEANDEGSRVLAAQVPKDDVRDLLTELGLLGVDPRHVCVDSFVLGDLVQQPGLDPHDAIAVIDLGAKRTLLNVSRNGITLMARTIDRGGNDVTEHLAQMQELELGAAEENKRLGVHIDDTTSTGKAVALAIDPLMAGLRATLMAFEASGAGEISRIYLCGGGARIEGLEQRFADSLGVPTSMLPRPDLMGRNQSDVPPEHALALALAIAGVPGLGSDALDLRRGEFAYRRDTRRIQALGMLGFVAMVLIGLWFVVSLGLDSRRLAKEAETMESQIAQMIGQVQPEMSKDRLQALSPSEGLAILEEEVNKLNAGGDSHSDFSDRSPLVILKKLSQAIPKNITIDVDEYRVDKESIRMTCRTESFEMADQLMNTLQKTSEFAKAEKSKQVRDRDGKTRFDITIPLPGTEAL